MDETLLRSHPLLEPLPAEVLSALRAECQLRDFAPGEMVLVRGDENQTLHFVLSGRLRVHLDAIDSGNGFDLSAGDIVGEMSIIARAPVGAWVVASEASSLLAMTEKFFWSRYVPVQEAVRALLYFLIGRVRRTNSALLKEFSQKLRYELMRSELENAWRIQASLLPHVRPFFPDHPGADAHALLRPAREVGGDFFDAFPLDSQRVCVAVGDVSGKGLPAALFMVRVVTLLRTTLLQSTDPASVLSILNRFLCVANDECMFVTLAIAILDTTNGRLIYLNGGHNPPLLAAGGGSFRFAPAPMGSLLGVNPNATFALMEAQLQPGDTLILYTDGIPEAENPGQAHFSDNGTLQALNQLAPSAELPAMLDGLLKAVAQFVGAAPQSDDITCLAIRLLNSTHR